MINLKYSLIIETTKDPTFFTFYSPDIEGFTGVSHSVEDCLYQAKWGTKEHLKLLKERKLPIPKENKNPEIIIRNERKLKVAV
jgi:predicted RNase H-like HicB family nuclease